MFAAFHSEATSWFGSVADVACLIFFHSTWLLQRDDKFLTKSNDIRYFAAVSTYEVTFSIFDLLKFRERWNLWELTFFCLEKSRKYARRLSKDLFLCLLGIDSRKRKQQRRTQLNYESIYVIKCTDSRLIMFQASSIAPSFPVGR